MSEQLKACPDCNNVGFYTMAYKDGEAEIVKYLDAALAEYEKRKVKESK